MRDAYDVLSTAASDELSSNISILSPLARKASGRYTEGTISIETAIVISDEDIFVITLIYSPSNFEHVLSKSLDSFGSGFWPRWSVRDGWW